jgi:SSS family solute:Na+ symporter
LAILSMFIAPFIANAPDGLFGYLQEINGCYSIPILTIIIVGYLTKSVPSIAANIAILSGSVLYFISQFVLQPYFGKENYPHFLHIMAVLFIFNVLLMLVIGKFYPRKEHYELVYTNQVDITPWKYARISGIAVVVIVIWTYIYFS